jgi:hypothetical protein
MAPKTKTLSVENFRNKVLQEVQDVCAREGLKFDMDQARGFAFQKRVASLICLHEGVEEEKVTTFSTNDLKFDVIIEDDDQKVLYFCQTKFVSVRSNPDLPAQRTREFQYRSCG